MRHIFIALVAALFIGVMMAVVTEPYVKPSSHSDSSRPLVIRGPEKPRKVPPVDPDGMKVPHRDVSVLDLLSDSRSNKGVLEKLLPKGELLDEIHEALDATDKSAPPRKGKAHTRWKSPYLIQLGALPSEDSARREWRRIKKRYPDLVGDLSPILVPLQARGSNWILYRIQVGPMGKESELAQALCRQLRARGQDCFVNRDVPR